MKYFCLPAFVAFGLLSALANAAPLALLQPADHLSQATLEAARFDWQSAGLGYVGVWADDAASCALIDSAPYDLFRIITPTTLTGYAATCSIAQSEKTRDGFALSGICEGEGERNPTTIQIRIIDRRNHQPGRCGVQYGALPLAGLSPLRLPSACDYAAFRSGLAIARFAAPCENQH